MQRVLVAAGRDVVLAHDGREAAEAIASRPFDVVVTDVNMPGISGVELLRAVRAKDLDVPVILVTGDPSLEVAMEAISLGALQYLAKPTPNDVLVAAVTRASLLHKIARVKRDALSMDASSHLAGDQAGLQASFERALDTMWIAFQPIVFGESRALYGYEALMRAKEPSLPHPGAILDAAERLGRLEDLGRRVRSLSARDFEHAPADARLFVNLHTRDLLDPALFDPEQPLSRVANRVVLEITERASLHAIRDVQKRVAALREMGFRLAIDDLGAGYAGLNSFSQLEPEVAKLDMALVRDVHKQPTKLTLVRTMISMCRELGIQVVAEGIETAEERDALVWAGCDLLQGYLFAKPGPAFPPSAF
jgi:EAL domain-containing protein (putative c-di-GMP-specific phosphodiesterase class I)